MEDFFKYTEMSIALKRYFVRGFPIYILLGAGPSMHSGVSPTSILTQHREVPGINFFSTCRSPFSSLICKVALCGNKPWKEKE